MQEYVSKDCGMQVCGVYDSGELSVVEYGSSEVLGSCRVSGISQHILSISLNSSQAHATACTVAHLEGKKDIDVVDLISGAMLATIKHTAKVDWLVRPNFTWSQILS
jgi:intraflagellar transport protein 172